MTHDDLSFDDDAQPTGYAHDIDEPVPMPEPPVTSARGTSKTEEKRLRDLMERASQGDRTDWESHLRRHTPKGHKVVPNSQLAQKMKLRRAASLKAAAERRQGRSDGVTIHYDRRAWSKLKQQDKDAFTARKMVIALTIPGPEAGKRWDAYRDFYRDYGDGDDLDSLSHLFRSGMANPPRHRGDTYPEPKATSRFAERKVWSSLGGPQEC